MLKTQVTGSGVPVAVGRMRWLAVLGIVLTAVTYLLSTFTMLGQAVVDEAWLTRVSEGRGWLRASRLLLEFIDVGTVTGVVITLLVVTAVRGNWRIGAALGIGLFGATASAELLKVVLPRPDLAPRLEAMMGEHAANSFPSGHVTIVTASVVAALVLLPAAHRLPLTLLGAVLVATVSCAVVAAGWHRPSDALGGLGWGLAWQALIAAVLVKTFGNDRHVRTHARWLWPASVSVLLVGAVALLATLVKVQGWQWPFALAEMVLATTALLVITTTGWILRNMSVEVR